MVHVLLILVSFVNHCVSRKMARSLLHRLVLRDLHAKFDKIADEDLEDALRKVYAGSCQQASLSSHDGIVIVRTSYWHFHALCTRYGIPELVNVICATDTEYWKQRLSGWFDKVTKF